jgi:large subunit ribosomal protein L25
MDQYALDVQTRDVSQRAALVRREKMIPAVVYGHNFENAHLQMDYQTFRRTFEKATYSTIINLAVDKKDAVPVLVHDVQYHPVSDEIVHVDFYKVNMNEKVTTNIAIEYVGVSEAVKMGAVLNINKQDVEVSCLPADLVHNIEVDISALTEIGDTIRVSDIIVPSGIEILNGEDEPLVSAIEEKIVEEEEVVEGENLEGAEGEGGEGGEGEAAEGGEGGEEKGE